MAEFNSPLGNKKIPGSNQMKEVVVPDESQGYPAQVRQGPPQGKNIPFDFNAFKDFQNRFIQSQQEEQMQNEQQYQQVPQQYSPQMPSNVQYNVSDKTNYAEVEQKVKEAKQAKRKGYERLSDGARNRIEMLIGMSRANREVTIDNTVFVLQTLKNKELRDVIVASAEFDGTVQFSFETSKQILARSLIQVANIDINEFLNSDELEARLSFVEELPQPLFTRLYSEYAILDSESRDKYSIKNTNEVKDVVNDLKK